MLSLTKCIVRVNQAKVDLDVNHPVIVDLKKETAQAKDEAAKARKGLFTYHMSKVCLNIM